MGSCVVEAVAGSGKTTTILQGLQYMHGSIFIGAYNKKIADELEQRAGKRAGLFIGTMHKAGLRALARAFPGVKTNVNKCREIYRVASDANPQYRPFEGSVLKLVSLAKQSGIGALANNMGQSAAWLQLIEHYDIEVFDEETGQDNTQLIMKLARKTLLRSIELDPQFCDFDDMVYSPLFHNVKVFENDWVLIDEGQDTNATRRALALRMLKRGGRLVVVGDRHQAIYGFTGADSDALDLIATAVNAKQLPLTVSYRCPRAVVAYAQQWVSHIQAAESAPEGIVSHADSVDLVTLAKPGDAILCRFNAPLVEYVYKFIAEGIPAKVEGRQIGDGLRKLASKWKRIKTFSALRGKLEGYIERETAKFRAKEQESKAVAVEDMVTCLNVIIDRAEKLDPKARDAVAAVCAEIDNIFAEDVNAKSVVLCSIHKSKGREWHKVLWLQTGPSPWARKAWEVLQESNLQYVAATRAMHELVLVDISKG